MEAVVFIATTYIKYLWGGGDFWNAFNYPLCAILPILQAIPISFLCDSNKISSSSFVNILSFT